MSVIRSDYNKIRVVLPAKRQALKGRIMIRITKACQEERKEPDNLISQNKIFKKGNKDITILKYRNEQKQRKALETIKEVSEDLECERNNKSFFLGFNQYNFNRSYHDKKEQTCRFGISTFKLQEDEILAASIISIAIIGYLIFKLTVTFMG